MTGYVRNTFQAQTPIGQAMQNIAQSMFQARVMKQQQALQQQEMAMKQAEFDARMPLLQAQAEAQQASAAKDRMAVDEASANMARAKAMPDTIASSFANLTRPQLAQVRGFQQEGNWGEAPTIAGLDSLGSGGDWMPTFANPQTMQKVNQADMMTGMMSGDQKADNIANAITQMMLNSQLGSGDMQGLNAASAALKGKLRGDPNAQGLYQNQDVGGGVVGLDMGNPLVANEVNRGKAYSAHQYAGANQANAAAALNRANIGKVNAQTQNERAGNTPAAKGALTEAQRMEINRKNEEITAARMMIKAYRDGGGLLADKAGDPEFQKRAALAMQKYSGVPDPGQKDWIGFLAGRGYETGQGYTKAGQKPAAQKPAAASGKAKQPAVGEVRKGYRFRGGDPSDKGSWEYVGGA
jgi:hypothetical protein